MKKQTRAMKSFGVVLMLLGFILSFSPMTSSRGSTGATIEPSTIAFEPQECSECEGKCKGWIDKCKAGGQYGCYKAAACLCKCNLDAGGCGSSREALQECYEKNEKLAKELEPVSIESNSK